MIVPERIVLASNNKGKINEFEHYFAALSIEIVPQSRFTEKSVAETGLSFIENALIKARFASSQSNLPALADDSGLCVTALAGKPGIHSARYAADQADQNVRISSQSTSNADNINKLLDEMKDIPDDQRQAGFHCVLAFIRHTLDPLPIICHGQWQGRITRSKHGKAGFGYDPIFQPEGYTCTAAELDLTEKNHISHRAQAMKILMENMTYTGSPVTFSVKPI